MNKTYGKRILSLLMVLTLVFSLMSGITVFAADDILNTSLSFSKDTVAPGDTVTVTVSLTNYNSTFAASYPISALQIDVAVDTSLVTVSNVKTLETSGAFGGASAANYNASAEKVTYADIYMASGAYVALAAASDGVVEIMSFDITVAANATGEIPFEVVTVANDGTSDAYSANDDIYTLAVGSGVVTPTQYAITVKNPANGTVSVDKTTATAGEVVTVTATANNGFYVKEIKVDGVAISGNTFTVTGNHTVEVKFEKVKYTITVGSVSNGTVSVDKTSAELNAKIKVTATPNDGYELGAILVDGVAISGKEFTVTGNHTVTATFNSTAVEPTVYDITVGTVTNGTVTVDKTTAEAGETVTVTATANNGYELSEILVDGVAISGNTFTVTGAHTVTATFKAKVVESEEYTITVTYGGKGTGSVTIVTSAAAGETVDFTATPALTSAGLACICTLISSDDVEITVAVSAVGFYTGGSFVMPASDVAITVNFQILGDINLNGGINGIDLAQLKKYTANPEASTLSAEAIMVANVAGTSNTTINGIDLAQLKKFTANPDTMKFPNGTY